MIQKPMPSIYNQLGLDGAASSWLSRTRHSRKARYAQTRHSTQHIRHRARGDTMTALDDATRGLLACSVRENKTAGGDYFLDPLGYTVLCSVGYRQQACIECLANSYSIRR